MFTSHDYFEALDELVAITDKDYLCQYVNTAFCKVFSRSSSEWIAKRIDPRNFKHCSILPVCDASIEAKFITKFEYNGRLTTIEWTRTVMPTGDHIFIGHDITHSATRIAKLEKAVEDTEAASEAKMRFLATMSHEMRTPLNGILGMAGLLQDTGLSPAQSSYTDAIRESGSSLLALINDILDFSKVEAGKFELEKISFDPTATVQGVLELLSTRSVHKGLEVVSYLDPQLPERIIGDEARFRQILLNIVGNAVKFTEEGGVSLAMHCSENAEPSKIDLKIEIEDTGIGIPDHALEKIFEEFAQADSSHARKFEGTGLGLSIARKIATAMGGTITVTSKVNEGSKFTITLCCDMEKNYPLNTPAPFVNTKVAIISNSSVLTKNITLQAKATGACEVASFQSFNSCIDYLEKNPEALLLCDLSVAVTHGQKLVKAAKNALVLLSPVARGRLDAFQRIGFSGYLMKPVRQSTLKEWVIRDFSQFENMVSDMSEKADSGDFQPVANPPHTSEPTAEEAPSASKSYKILLAEDNKINALLATTVIKKAGHEVDHALDGAEAIEALHAKAYDLVLMDMRMPNMDGLEATKTLRNLSSSIKNIPVIALTANAMQSDRETCLAAGMDDYMTKPFNPEDLMRVITKWVNKKETTDLSEVNRISQ